MAIPPGLCRLIGTCCCKRRPQTARASLTSHKQPAALRRWAVRRCCWWWWCAGGGCRLVSGARDSRGGSKATRLFSPVSKVRTRRCGGEQRAPSAANCKCTGRRPSPIFGHVCRVPFEDARPKGKTPTGRHKTKAQLIFDRYLIYLNVFYFLEFFCVSGHSLIN